MLSKKTKVKYGEKKKKGKHPKVYIQIYDKWCKRCAICIQFCAHRVLIEDENGFPKAVKPVDCNICGKCVLRCPDFAISIREAKGNKNIGIS
jgi:2-oxoglutarate ferredoxin oxidoreductase subunit delta